LKTHSLGRLFGGGLGAVMHILILLLPTIWAIVSTTVAVVLYRSSSAIFSGNELMGLPAKKVRLTGSIVIAIIIFLLIRGATPVENLIVNSPDSLIMSRDQKVYLELASDQLEASIVDLNGCIAMESVANCAEVGQRARVDAADLKNRILSLGK